MTRGSPIFIMELLSITNTKKKLSDSSDMGRKVEQEIETVVKMER